MHIIKFSQSYEEIAIRGDLFSLRNNNDYYINEMFENSKHEFNRGRTNKWDFSSNLFKKNVTNEVRFKNQ